MNRDLKAKNLDLETGANIILVNERDAALLNIHPGDRLNAIDSSRSAIAIANITDIVPNGIAGVTKNLKDELRARNGDKIELEARLRRVLRDSEGRAEQ